MSKQKDSLIFYYGWFEDFKNLSKTEIADVVMAAYDYEINGVVTELKSRSARIVLRNITKMLDINRQKYDEKCEKNRSNAASRWEREKKNTESEECERMRSHTNASFRISENAKNADTVYVNEKETYKDTYNDNVYVNDNDESSSSGEETHTYKKLYGVFSNISLEEQEYEEFVRMHPSDYQQRIDSMSSYMKAQGKTYKDDFARLCSWKLYDKEEEKSQNSSAPSYDADAYMKKSLYPVYKSQS